MKKITFTKEQLDYMSAAYQNKEKTTLQLSKEFNCSQSTIERRLKENGIVLKPKFPYENLIGKRFGQLLVVEEDIDRYKKDILATQKPHRYWKCVCDCGNMTFVEGSHLKDGHTISCGCVKSKGQKKIAKILCDNNIQYVTEVSFSDLVGIGDGLLKFDFGIIKNDKLQYLIEYNGEQHYIAQPNWGGEERLKIQIENDNLKKSYCEKNNIPLIIIPYTIYDKLDINNLLL